MIFRALFFEHDAEIRQKGHLWTDDKKAIYGQALVNYRFRLNQQILTPALRTGFYERTNREQCVWNPFYTANGSYSSAWSLVSSWHTCPLPMERTKILSPGKFPPTG